MRHPLTTFATVSVTVVAAYTFGTSLAASMGAPAWQTELPPYEPQIAAERLPLTPSLPPEGRKIFGVATESGPYDLEEFEAFADAAGKDPDVLMFAQDWANHDFDRGVLDRILDRGAIPMIAWEPWDESKESDVARLRGEQPHFALHRIIDGSFDRHIEEWAEGVADWGWPVLLRFAHEMNGDWYPWSERSNGNRPGEYVEAWRHVHAIFEDAGAENVTWIWSPNVEYETTSPPLEGLYPGDEYVDWVGVVGFFGHTKQPPSSAPTFDELYGPTIDAIRELSDAPLLITEVGATEVGGFKARWIVDFLRDVAVEDEVIGFVWFDLAKETDWRIVSSEAARRSFARGIADPRFGIDVPRLLAFDPVDQR